MVNLQGKGVVLLLLINEITFWF